MEEEKKEQIENTVEEIKQDDNKLQQELDELTDRYKRILAEFENFKKRSSKERESLYISIVADVVGSLLPVMDNLEKAVNAQTQDESYKQGIELVYKQLQDVFTNLGVQKIESVGTTFDPEVHEAVSSVVDETLGEKVIKQEYQAGYKIGMKVIRHAIVVVAN